MSGDDQESNPNESLNVFVGAPTGLASIGSQEHGTGNCKPCAWFAKPEGCKNGMECRHCHMCPTGEIQRRRRIKWFRLKNQIGQAAVEQDDVDDGTSSHALEDRSFMPGVSDRVLQTFPNMKATTGRDAMCNSMPLVLLEPSGSLIADIMHQALPSIGSQAHGRGNCRPCAWFFKSEGCANGKDCRHCHACPAGEIQRRRKLKVATLCIERQFRVGSQDTSVMASFLEPPPGLCPPHTDGLGQVGGSRTTPEAVGETLRHSVRQFSSAPRLLGRTSSPLPKVMSAGLDALSPMSVPLPKAVVAGLMP